MLFSQLVVATYASFPIVCSPVWTTVLFFFVNVIPANQKVVAVVIGEFQRVTALAEKAHGFTAADC